MASASPGKPSLGERLSSTVKTLFSKKKPEPSYPPLPDVNESGDSNIPGIYMAGEVAGTPLIKLGLDSGHVLAERVHREVSEPSSDDDVYDLVIVGAGSSGLGAALRAKELGLSYLVIESDRIAQTVENMYKGKPLFAEPLDVEQKSNMWFEECSREELLEKWHAQIEREGLVIHEHEKVVDIGGKIGAFRVITDKDEYQAKRVILAIGKAGNPRKAGVPGEQEHADRIYHNLSDPAQFSGKKIFIYGGGDVACEATIALAGDNDVTMVTIDKELIYPKKRNKDRVFELADRGEIELHLDSKLVSIGDGTVTYKTADGDTHTVDNDVVFEMIGGVLPLDFFAKIGVKLQGTWDARRWIALALVSVFVYSLYALKKFPEEPYAWPFTLFIDTDGYNSVVATMFEVTFWPFGYLFTDEAYATMVDTTWFQQGYLYSWAYTVIMIVFGYTAFRRWAKVASDASYQKWRYISLVGFQVGFFLIANIIAVQALSLENAWRAWGLYQPWPLFFNTFHWWSGNEDKIVMGLFIGGGLIGTFVAIPLASYKHGKRFCTWVCGCGGLAETLGDRWRHLSPKGKRSRAWEFQGVVILVAAAIVTLVSVGAFDTRADNVWGFAYSYVVDFWLVAVIPIALYPFYGGKVWCRYWCPLAAWNQVLSSWYGKLQIAANEKCITCGECSKYCQVGVDVMAFAKDQEPFDNANSACIHCGICIDVCPMDVLYFDHKNGKVKLEASKASAQLAA